MGFKLFELSAEITGVSRIVTGLSLLLDNSMTDILTPDAMGDALSGVASYLERIADNLASMSNEAEKKGGAV